MRRVRETAEVVGLARESQWPVGPTPEPLSQKLNRSRHSDSSEESDSNSSIDGSSPASSISSPLREPKVPLQGINEVSIDDKKLTVRVLSRLRDLWELSNGYICLDDYYASPAPEGKNMGIDEFAQELGITLAEVDEKGENEDGDVVKKVVGENDVKRANIVKEIIDTEETYIRGLQELVEVLLPNKWC